MIPTYNEAATLRDVLDRVEQLGLDAQIVVADDGSTDGSAELLDEWSREHPGHVVLHLPHRGKGAAVRAAIPHLTGEITVIQDADREYDPVDVPAVIEPITRGDADVVFGSRLSGGRPQRAYLFWHLVANRLLALLANVLYNTTLHDIETGYKAFRTDVLRTLRLTRDDFGIEAELTGEVCRRKLRIYEIPVAYYGRTAAEGKKISWQDGFKAVRILLEVRLRR